MDRIVFKPGDVRGGGNIVSPAKVLKDFQRYNCKLALSSTTIDNQSVNVFTETYLPGSYFSITYNEWLPLDTEEFTLAVTLKYNNGNVISGATVTCTVNDGTALTGTTDENGKVSFTVQCSDYYVYTCRFEYAGNNNVAGCVRSVVVHIGEIDHVDLISEDAYTATGEVEWLMATVTGRDGDGHTIPASYYPVTFYETYTPGLRVKSNTKVMEAGDNSVWTGQVIDARDGSLVRLPGETLQFFEVFERDHINMTPLSPITIGDTAVLQARVFDRDNSLIRDVPVFFEEEIPGSSDYYCSPLTLSKDFVEEEVVTSIAVRVRDRANDNEPVPGVFVRFYADEEHDNEVIIPDTRPLPTITLTGPSAVVDSGVPFTISGVLGNVASATNKQIKLYEYDTLIDTLLCDGDGNFSKTITKRSQGSWAYKAVKEETALYQRAESNRVEVAVNVEDVIKYDYGTLSKHTDIWSQNTDYLARGTDYSTLSDSSARLIYTGVTGSILMEFDVKVGGSSSTFVSVRNGATSLLGASLNDLGLAAGVWNHILVEISNNVCTISNTSTSDTVTGSVTDFNRLYLSSAAGSYVSFRNFAVYSLGSLPSSITLTSTKSILSYYDEDYAVLSATVLDGSDSPLEGESVVFKKGGTVLGTVLTNSRGVAEYEYEAEGVGDVVFTASVGRLVSETYELVDAIRYVTGTVNISNWNVTLPSKYQINMKLRRNTSSNVGTCNLWRTSTQAIGVGLFNARDGQHGLGQYNGSSWSVDSFGSLSIGVTKEFIYTYDNGNHTLTLDETTKTLTLTNEVIKIDCNSSGSGVTISELIIKPL